MSQARTAAEKVNDWLTVYRAVQHELTPPEFRPLMALMQTGQDPEGINVQAVNIGVSVSRIVMANDRAAATVAALLTANGVKPIAFDYGEE